MKIKKGKTQRGFGFIEFVDSYGQECSIQISSNVIPHLWIGVDSTGKYIKGDNGEVNQKINGRMHIRDKDLPKLIKILQKYLDTGRLK